ncbi:hypothetical protein LX73_1689 [Fodinibius salinus]|uniref:Uncharacterized protein n=1 Tax=Fodinibius salinus TaxID=860790 RepID=A0A5D3YK96_9BACT|nr:hypothetical protein [Fodinibius salinus]TYP93972.1 hypothetical protein LX73_1689 [Fodinibius salinus]
MKKLLTATVLTVFLAISFTSLSHAQDADKNLGIGFIAGEPTGLSLKSWTGGNNAFDLGLAWSLGRYDAINIHGDYLWHNYNIFSDVNSGSLPVYFGIGGRVILADNDALIGARIPVGINYLFEDSPIGLFLEVAPVFNIAPATDFDVDGGIGVRFYL